MIGDPKKAILKFCNSSVILKVQLRVIYDLSGLQPLPLALTLGLAMLRRVWKFFSTGWGSVGGDFLCAHRSIIAATAADPPLCLRLSNQKACGATI